MTRHKVATKAEVLEVARAITRGAQTGTSTSPCARVSFERRVEKDKRWSTIKNEVYAKDGSFFVTETLLRHEDGRIREHQACVNDALLFAVFAIESYPDLPMVGQWRENLKDDRLVRAEMPGPRRGEHADYELPADRSYAAMAKLYGERQTLGALLDD